MVKKTGYVFGGFGLQASLAAIALYLLNFAVWSVLTAMMGGAMALIGLGLIMWALAPHRGVVAEKVKLIGFTPIEAEVA